MKDLQRRLEHVARSSGVRVGISVRGLGGEFEGREAGVNEEAVFQSASLIKVLILVELLREVDSGKVSLEETLGGASIGSLAEQMITVSDNAATNLIIDRIGFDAVNALARDLGLDQTHLGRKMLDFEAQARGEDNFTSASDMAALFTAIWDGEVLSPESREFALSALERQQLNSKLPAGLPSGTRVLHKTGELEGIEHDAGIVVVPEGAFVITALTQGDSTSGIVTIQRSANLAYETFSGR